jgi:hypothetical protein
MYIDANMVRSRVVNFIALSSVLFLNLFCSPFVRAQAPPVTRPNESAVATRQEKGAQARATGTKAQEAYVIEHLDTKVAFENDGTETREMQASLHILSDAGVQHWGVISFSYQNFNQTLDIDYVRVKKPDGTVVVTPPENTQDITSEISRVAPFYTDQREKHIAVKGLAPGDVLEYSSRTHVTKPLVPGQFWFEHDFDHDSVIIQEMLEVSLPSGRSIKLKSRGPKYEIEDDGGRRTYRWRYSNPERKEEDDEDEGEAWKQARGQEDQPDVILSSFTSWNEVGRWYYDLQRDRVKPTAEIQAKASELTRNAVDDATKLRAIYTFVSTKYRYIGIALGMGRYQPHPAAEVMDNGYGDCKDKHTLLASLLTAAGFKVYPALIHSQRDLDPDVPSPGQFNHVISVIVLPDRKIWLDTTPEVAPFAFLMSPLRGKRALLVSPQTPSFLETTPANPDVRSTQTFEMKAKLDDTGTLTGNAERTLMEATLKFC